MDLCPGGSVEANAHERVGMYMREHGIVGFMGAPYLPREACDCRCMFGVGSSLWGFVRPRRGARRGTAVPGAVEAPVVCEPPVLI